MREESWAAKVDEMSAVIQPLISSRRLQIPSNRNPDECDMVTGRTKVINH
jgi:hypothetical protein